MSEDRQAVPVCCAVAAAGSCEVGVEGLCWAALCWAAVFVWVTMDNRGPAVLWTVAEDVEDVPDGELCVFDDDEGIGSRDDDEAFEVDATTTTLVGAAIVEDGTGVADTVTVVVDL